MNFIEISRVECILKCVGRDCVARNCIITYMNLYMNSTDKRLLRAQNFPSAWVSDYIRAE